MSRYNKYYKYILFFEDKKKIYNIQMGTNFIV